MEHCEDNQNDNEQPFDMSKMTKVLRACETAKEALLAKYAKTPPESL